MPVHNTGIPLYNKPIQWQSWPAICTHIQVKSSGKRIAQKCIVVSMLLCRLSRRDYFSDHKKKICA